MATQAQINANRLNAQKSTGPRSDPGKAAVRQNALRHGLCCSIPLMDEENELEAKELLDILREENQPVGANEEILVYKLAEHFFNMKRAGYLITAEFDSLSGGADAAKNISILQRYHSAADRGFNQNLRELRKLQKERRLQEIGFDSQQPVEAAKEPETPPAPAPQPPPKAANPPVPAPIPAAIFAAIVAETPRTIENHPDRDPQVPRKAA